MSKKNKSQTPANDGADKKPSLERRGLRMALKIFAYILFISYLLWAVPHAKTWAEIVWVQRQPIEKLAEIAPALILEKRPDKIYIWVKMRKNRDIDQIMEILEPYTAELSPMTFMLYADRLATRNDMADAIFWYQYALYRMRFDALRCGQAEEAIGITSAMNKIYRNDKILAAVAQNQSHLPRTIRAVLEKDAQYPARNQPIVICQIVRKLSDGAIQTMAEENWAWVRHALRDQSEKDLKRLEASLQKQTQDALTPEETPVEAPQDSQDPPKEQTAPENNETTETP